MAKEPFPLDRGWAWVIVFGSFVNVFFMVGTGKSLGLFLNEFRNYFGVPTSLAAMVMGGSSIVFTIMSPVCILLGQRFQARRVMMVCTLIAFLGLSLGSLLISMEYVIATFGIGLGLGNSSIYGNSLVMLGIYFHKHRTLANGLALTGASAGQFLLPLLIEYMLETYSLQGCLLLIGGLYFHTFLASSLFRSPSFYSSIDEKVITLDDLNANDLLNENGHVTNGLPLVHSKLDEIANAKESQSSPLVDKEIVAVDGKSLSEDGLKYKSFMTSSGSICIQYVSHHGSSVVLGSQPLAKDRQEKKSICLEIFGFLDFSSMKNFKSIFIIFVNFLSFFGYFNFILFLPSHVISRGVTNYEKATLVSLCGLGDFLGRLSMAILGDRNLIARYKLKAFGLVTLSLNIGGMIFANHFAWMAVHCTLYGVFGGIYVSLLAVVLIDFVGMEKMPRLLGVVLLIQGLGISLGQPLLGAVRDMTGSFEAVMIICSMTSLVGGFLLFFYPIVHRMEEKQLKKCGATHLAE